MNEIGHCSDLNAYGKVAGIVKLISVEVQYSSVTVFGHIMTSNNNTLCRTWSRVRTNVKEWKKGSFNLQYRWINETPSTEYAKKTIILAFDVFACECNTITTSWRKYSWICESNLVCESQSDKQKCLCFDVVGFTCETSDPSSAVQMFSVLLRCLRKNCSFAPSRRGLFKKL